MMRRDATREPENLSWELIIEQVPILDEMYQATVKIRGMDIRPLCGNYVWYGYMKPTLHQIVGHYRDDELGGPGWLFDSHAYDIAYQKICNAIPGCSHYDQCCWGYKRTHWLGEKETIDLILGEVEERKDEYRNSSYGD